MKDLLLVVVIVGVLVGGVHTTGTQAQIPGGDEEELAVLVFTRTQGFRHLSIPEGVLAVTELGLENGFAVTHTEDPEVFTDAELSRFAAVIFLNTTGEVLTDPGREAFERYVRGGGAWVGVHAAADTEYDWPFYAELLAGAYFLSHPIQQPGELENEAPDHPSTAHLPERWQIPFEEYYSFQRNPRPDVRVLLNIDEDSYDQDPNTTNLPDSPDFPEGVSGVMGDHPMSWCQEIDAGHAWYTALGHEGYLYRTPDFRAHLLGGILTAAGQLEADCTPRAAQAPGTGEPAGQPAPQPTESPATPPPSPPADPQPAGERSPLPATGTGLAGAAVLLLVLALGARSWSRP
jgi:uncharacterized protein